MALQDIIALLALIAALVTVPAGVLAYRSSRKEAQTEGFKRAMDVLRDRQVELNAAALDESPESWRLPELPILGKREWVPTVPLDIRDIGLTLAEERPEPRSKTDYPLPSSTKKADRQGYSAIMQQVGGLDLFNGRIYRLTGVDADLKHMEFAVAKYYDYLDSSEVMAYESAERVASGRKGVLRGSYRKALGDPFSLKNRVTSLGINTLTIRLNGGDPTFFLHERDPKKVAIDSALISVAPAGEFTPSDRTLESVQSDFSLWRNIMREYAEEFLGHEEARGRGGRWIDYATSSPYVELQRGIDEGSVRCWVLGLGLDPLNWKPELMTVCVLDSNVFDTVFEEMVERNDEGEMLVGPQDKGLKFDEATVNLYARAAHTAPSTKACLLLAWQHRELFGVHAT